MTQEGVPESGCTLSFFVRNLSQAHLPISAKPRKDNIARSAAHPLFWCFLPAAP